MNRRLALSVALSTAFVSLAAAPVHAADFPTHAIEIIVPFNAGGGTDALARAFADNARKHLPQAFVVNNKPGASSVIGWSDVVNSKPDGYKLALMTVELTILPHLGLSKFGVEEFTPIARLNYDPAAITVKADAPWNTVEEFVAAAKKANGEMKMGNSGNGSIWHLAAASVEDKTGAKFSHIPYPGAAPAVLSLLGGHIDAVAVSPAEVAPHLASGKLKMLGVMADQRLKAFEKVPTLKERGIDVSIGAWRGLGAPKGTPKDVIEILKIATQKTMAEPAMREAMDKLALGYSYGDDAAFKDTMDRNNAAFKVLVPKLNLKP
jgi:tripartite-type tricarboxylate transporter receptor subunit TctC